MKSIFKLLLVICAVCMVCSACTKKQPANYAIISGELSNSEGKEAGIMSSPYVPIGDKSETIRKTLKIDAQGTFVDTVYLEKGRDFIFHMDKGFLNINLSPGDKLHLSADGNDLVSTVKYSGSAAPICNYLLEFNSLFRKHNEEYSKTLKLGEKEFINAQNNYQNSIYALLESTDGLSDEFIAAQKKDVHYGIVSSYLNYDERHGSAVGDESFTTSPNFLDIVSSVNMEDPKELSRSLHYGFLLKKYYTHEFAKVGDFYEEMVTFLQFLEKNITDPVIKEELLFLYGVPVIASTKKVELCYDILTRNISNEQYLDKITERYNELKRIQPGQVSPVFTNYQNAAGGTNSLSDFKGKYVYIDVWATWCGPCKAEIPYLKEVEKLYHNKNIVFISLSIDSQRDVEKWKGYVKEQNMGGIQLISDNDRKSEFIAKYNIEGIPRFILIDPDGKIVDADAPRPSDEKLIELFDNLEI